MKNQVPKTSAQNGTHGWIGTETVETRFGTFEFNGGYPTADSTHSLGELLVFNRAIEVYLSQMPGVSTFHVRKGLSDFGARGYNQFVIWETLMDAETLLVTGNSELVYGLSFLDLKRDGPTVVDVPAGLLGGFCDMWQEQIMDIGPTGSDKGAGGTFLILPPHFEGIVPPGYYSAKSRTFGVCFAVRGYLVDGKPDKAVALMKAIRIYPVAKKTAPLAMAFLNGSGRQIDTIFPDNYQYFESLVQLIEQEPAEVVPSHERFFLASIGIEKGTSFRPDASRKRLLADAAWMGSAMARRNGFASNDPERIVYPDRRWESSVVGASPNWDSQGYVNSDRRATFAYSTVGMSAAMALKVIGGSPHYFLTMRDASGTYLDGSQSYRLNLPARIPVKNFWSVVVYDAESRSMLRTGQKFPSVSQYTNPTTNADGSVDIYFGPRLPQGIQNNWIQTVEGRGWFPLLRFYSPLQSLFDHTWKPGDIEALSEPQFFEKSARLITP